GGMLKLKGGLVKLAGGMLKPGGGMLKIGDGMLKLKAEAVFMNIYRTVNEKVNGSIDRKY
uniref:Uncharacterized protein n=1 Tax=Caenorhabditis japonica TaxID=281687 RepID=A0A8R1IER6_CAEJA